MYIDDFINRVYANSLIITDIIIAIKIGNRWLKYLKKVMCIFFIKYYLVNERVIFKDRLVVSPDDNKVQFELIYRIYASILDGYPGRDKTLNIINRIY